MYVKTKIDMESSNDSSDLPPISLVHIDFDDLRNGILEMDNSNSPAVFDQLLSDFSNIPDDGHVDTEATTKDDNQTDDNQTVDNETVLIEDDEASTHSTVDSTTSGRSGGSGIKLVPIESLMQSTVDGSKKIKDKRTVKCHSESAASVEELSSEAKSDDSDDDNDGDDVEFSKSRHKRKTKSKNDLKKRFQKLREKAQARRPNYAERSNSEESDETSDDGGSEGAESRQKTKSKSRSANTKASSSKKQKDVYGATVRLTKLPSNLETLLYKYDLIEIRDRHQKILASRPHRNEVAIHRKTHHTCVEPQFSIKINLFLCLLRCVCILHTLKEKNTQPKPACTKQKKNNQFISFFSFQKQAESVSKRLLNDGNCKANNEDVDNQLTEPAAKKQVSFWNLFFD